MKNKKQEGGLSPIISVVLLAVIVILISSLSSVYLTELLQKDSTVTAAVAIEEDSDVALTSVEYVNSGTSTQALVRGKYVNQKLLDPGDKITFASQDIEIVAQRKGKNGEISEETLIQKYKPNPTIDEKSEEGEFTPVYISEDDAYSAMKYDFTNRFAEEVKVTGMEINVVQAKTKISHYHNSDDGLSSCSGSPSPDPYCSLVYIDSDVSDGWVDKDIEQNLPVRINAKDTISGGKGKGHYIDKKHWKAPVMSSGHTSTIYFYRFQYSASDKQITSFSGEEVYFTMWFDNGESITIQDTVGEDLNTTSSGGGSSSGGGPP